MCRRAIRFGISGEKIDLHKKKEVQGNVLGRAICSDNYQDLHKQRLPEILQEVS